MSIILLLFVLVAAIAVIVMVRREPSRFLTLRDGTRIEFLGTSVGAATFTTEKPWHTFLKKILPRLMTRWIPAAASGSCSSGTNSITAYFRVISSPASTTSTPWNGYQTKDEGGFIYHGGGLCSFGGGPGGSNPIYGLILRAYPRRQKEFQFEFLDKTNGILGSVQVPNPVHGPFPAWQPQPLPQTKTNGPVTLTLLSMHEDGNERWRYANPKWKIEASDPSWRKAKVRYTHFQDATGNEDQWLSRTEPAWKAQAFVFRERSEDFADNERLVITNLTFPAPGEFVAVDQTVTRNGVSLTVHLLANAGELRITNGVARGMSTNLSSGHNTSSDGKTTIETWGSPLPFVLVEAGNVQSADDIWLRVRDENGKEIELPEQGVYDGTSCGGRMYKRTLSRLDLKSVSLEVIVNRPLEFEFMVNPADMRPPQPKPKK